MTCFYYRMLVSHALDGDRPLSRQVQRHLAHCRDCRAFHGAALGVRDRIRSVGARDEPVDAEWIARRVAAQLGRGEAPRRRDGAAFPRVRWTGALAAALPVVILIAVLAGLWLPRPDDPEPSALSLARSAEPLATWSQEIFAQAQTPDPLTIEAERLAEDAASATRALLSLVRIGLSNGTRPE